MTVQLTIIGLGQIGASIGLALADETHQLERVGHDSDIITARKAEKLGAIDRFQLNLHTAVENADLVVLALPADEVRDVLKEIAPDLKAEVVVIDTAPIKTAVTRWVQDLLPPDRFFLTFTPTLNPAYLLETASGIDAAHADLFKNSLMYVTATPGASADAIKLASDLALLLGARPIFSDAYEADGLTAAGSLLPKLVAAALVNATTGQPGWNEVRKVAGQAYAMGSEPLEHLDDTNRLGQAALLNPDNAVRVLDDMIAALQQLRQAVAGREEDQLHTLLENARQERIRWLSERGSGKWDIAPRPEMPAKGEFVSRFFGLSALQKMRGKGGKEDQEKKK